MKRLFFFFLFVSGMLSLPSYVKKLTQGFRLSKLEFKFPYEKKWETAFNPGVHEILRQKFKYIGKGAQSFVFASEDGQHVLKLFRHHKTIDENKTILLFNACKIAYDHLREETGLIYVHLNQTEENFPKLHLKDAIGRSYTINLNRYRFAIQKKARPFRKTLLDVLNDPIQMRKRLDQFFHLLKARACKKIINTDSNLSRNFGFLEDRLIEFDFGNYRYHPTVAPSQEISRYALKLRRWLEVHAPEWVSYLDGKVKDETTY